MKETIPRVFRDCRQIHVYLILNMQCISQIIKICIFISIFYGYKKFYYLETCDDYKINNRNWKIARGVSLVLIA